MSTPGRFLTAEWRRLAMVSWEVEPARLAPLVPRGTELDAWERRTFLSVVGFLFLRTRVLGWPVPFHRDFPEVNLRFYVRHRAKDGWRRGVVFLKEIVPRRAIAWVARTLYHERYVALPMRASAAGPEGGTAPGPVEYAWLHRGAWDRLRVEPTGRPAVPAPGSVEAFITEHYWGYTALPGGGTLEYGVEHPPWRVWPARGTSVVGSAALLYGPRLAEVLATPPASALLAEGSPVVVRRPRRLALGAPGRPGGA